MATFIALWLVMLAAPQTPIARALRWMMVAVPAAFLARITPGHVLFALLLIGFVAMVGWWLEADGLRMLGMAAPEITAWAMTFEITTYLDIIATLAVTASAMRMRSARTYLQALFTPQHRRPVRRARRATRRRPAAPPPAANDGDGHDLCIAA